MWKGLPDAKHPDTQDCSPVYKHTHEGTHTHTHTLLWLLYVVNFHLVHKNSPQLLSLGHTHAHFRCPPPRTRRHHSHTLHSWERAGCMALILRTQAHQCCLLPCVQPHQKAGPGNGARSERSLSRGASPPLYPLPFLSGAQSLQARALSSHPRARPCPPRQTPAGSGAVLSPPSGSGPHVDPRLVQGGRPCTPPPLEAAQVWPASLSPHPRSAPVAVAVRREGAGAVCRLSLLPPGLPYLWVLSDSPAHPGLLRQRPVHLIPCAPLHLNSRPGEAPVPVSSAVVSDDFLGAGGPCQPPREPRSTKLSVPSTSLFWLLSASIFFLGCVTPSEWLQFLKRQALEFLNFPVPWGLKFKSDHPEHPLQGGCKSVHTFPQDTVTDPTKMPFLHREGIYRRQ